jgi:geranylgeranyl diphosphate synthase, type II
MFNLKTCLSGEIRIIEAALDVEMPPKGAQPAILHKAMRYSVFSGGKRIRPVLCLCAAEAVGANGRSALLPAVAVELLHTYTLIHDDLPCMDDDDFRRGKPTCHKVFGEANAVLAGDALQALAFETLAKAKPPSRYPPNQLMLELAHAAGSRGVVGGQVEDLAFDGRHAKASSVRFIHLHKTADLFRAAVRMGAIAGNATKNELEALTEYGVNFGLAFQIADDLLDATVAAKPGRRKSAEMNCISVYGHAAAKKKANAHIRKAVSALAGIRKDSAEPLIGILRFAVNRAL